MTEKKMVSDLEKMNKDRRKAEEVYLAGQKRMLEMQRIIRDGITKVEELVLYVNDVIASVSHDEDVARTQNNSIVYSEAIGIRREFSKLLNLVTKDKMTKEKIDGTEEKHRLNNEGEEGYQ